MIGKNFNRHIYQNFPRGIIKLNIVFTIFIKLNKVKLIDWLNKTIKFYSTKYGNK